MGRHSGRATAAWLQANWDSKYWLDEDQDGFDDAASNGLSEQSLTSHVQIPTSPASTPSRRTVQQEVPYVQRLTLSASVPSQGSVLHGTGNCRPCAWFWKPAGCMNGSDCNFCHACPEDERKMRRMRRLLHKTSVDGGASGKLGESAPVEQRPNLQKCLSTSPARPCDFSQSSSSPVHRFHCATPPQLSFSSSLPPSPPTSPTPPPACAAPTFAPPPVLPPRPSFDPRNLPQQKPRAFTWQVRWERGAENAGNPVDGHDVLLVPPSPSRVEARVLLVTRRGMISAFELTGDGLDEMSEHGDSTQKRSRSCPPKLCGSTDPPCRSANACFEQKHVAYEVAPSEGIKCDSNARVPDGHLPFDRWGAGRARRGSGSGRSGRNGPRLRGCKA